jgi:nitroreductase
METWDAIRARRNVRVFDERPLADADLDRILEAGRRAPSSRNCYPADRPLVPLKRPDRRPFDEVVHRGRW